jgi:hypothetical protein
LDTITLSVFVEEREKMGFLLDYGADLCLCKHGSTREGSVYNSARSFNVKVISNVVEKTGEIALKLSTDDHEAEHKFQLVADKINIINISCDGILGKDFFEDKKVKIDYERREIVTGYLRIKFDDNNLATEQLTGTFITLKPIRETIVMLPTLREETETGLVSATELVPGVIIAEKLTVVRQGTCLTSIVNTNDHEIKVGLLTVMLDPYELDAARIRTVSIQRIEETEHRIRDLRNMIRTDLLNDMEQKSIVKICDDNNDIFHLPGDRLPVTTAQSDTVCRSMQRNCKQELSPAGSVKRENETNYRSDVKGQNYQAFRQCVEFANNSGKEKEHASKKQK